MNIEGKKKHTHMHRSHILYYERIGAYKLSKDNYHSSVSDVVSCFCIESDGMPVRRREAGQVGVKGNCDVLSPCVCLCVCVICLVPVGLVFHQRLFDVRSKMGGWRK